ncbi:hypothetical protein ACFFQF_05175 [Haladaptatus pallidirubidus]|uniref:hypothetical protein n=1 Tax=Haladaptatus pallidirubidus TaxID=1008152 RepID=UPI001D117D86|nr:hypothetical protein [Haladaptatus pallidirubidus]
MDETPRRPYRVNRPVSPLQLAQRAAMCSPSDEISASVRVPQSGQSDEGRSARLRLAERTPFVDTVEGEIVRVKRR